MNRERPPIDLSVYRELRQGAGLPVEGAIAMAELLTEFSSYKLIPSEISLENGKVVHLRPTEPILLRSLKPIYNMFDEEIEGGDKEE